MNPDYISKLKTATEEELRDMKDEWPKTEADLADVVGALAERQHTYGTCVYAISIAATSAFNFIAHKLGVTGFQASCADMDVLRRTRGYKHGFSIQDYGNLLYPQYCDEGHFPSWRDLIDKNKEDLGAAARKLLSDAGEHTHPNVKEHWAWLASQTDVLAEDWQVVE